ncbi:MAG: hypothetical protein WAM78_13465, partial [Candidatus Sulfotelmatobacter sp.]
MQALSLYVKHIVILFLVLAASASICLYWRRITDAVHASRASSSVLKPKVLTDLYPSWYGSRELLL